MNKFSKLYVSFNFQMYTVWGFKILFHKIIILIYVLNNKIVRSIK